MHDHSHGDESCGRGAQGQHRGFRPPFGMRGMAGMHGQGFGHGGPRARRGDIRAAVLRLLSETPMHGYQIIQELSARSAGAWSPSAGSVYPTLQLLADEGLIVSAETAGKKVFSLTEAGTAAVAETAGQPAPWEEAAQSDSGNTGYREAVAKLMPAVFQLGKNGTKAQVDAALEVLDDARKKLYAILAED
jgi:DNA-binding PadR family transcriptional regulator